MFASCFQSQIFIFCSLIDKVPDLPYTSDIWDGAAFRVNSAFIYA